MVQNDVAIKSNCYTSVKTINIAFTLTNVEFLFDSVECSDKLFLLLSLNVNYYYYRWEKYFCKTQILHSNRRQGSYKNRFDLESNFDIFLDGIPRLTKMPFVNGRRVKTELAAVDSVNSNVSAGTALTVSSEDDGTVNAAQYTVERPDGPDIPVSNKG